MDRRDMVIRKGGTLVILIDGDMRHMETEMFAADGTVIRTDGTLLLPDGTTRIMREDEALLIDMLATRMEE